MKIMAHFSHYLVNVAFRCICSRSIKVRGLLLQLLQQYYTIQYYLYFTSKILFLILQVNENLETDMLFAFSSS